MRAVARAPAFSCWMRSILTDIYLGRTCSCQEILRMETPPGQEAAARGHAGAQFMYGDCLLEGIGVGRDAVAAVPLLLSAAEQGHRGARSRLLSLLDAGGQVADGQFTDSSRQSYTGAGGDHGTGKM
eukprot:COSAG01_NODE_12791_length_1685_cov_1.468474_1_plen_127_part_00